MLSERSAFGVSTATKASARRSRASPPKSCRLFGRSQARLCRWLPAGGAAAAIIGPPTANLYAAVWIHPGLAYVAASDMPSAFAAMRQGGSWQVVPTGRPGGPADIFHGDSDATVHLDNGAQAIEQARSDQDADEGGLRADTWRAWLYPYDSCRRRT
jgi:poly(3-hydroxybutyrate) depolymerase